MAAFNHAFLLYPKSLVSRLTPPGAPAAVTFEID